MCVCVFADREHGNEFSTQFEESCLRLEDAAEALAKFKEDQKKLLAQLRIGEYFYDQQHSEARIVVNVRVLSCAPPVMEQGCFSHAKLQPTKTVCFIS